MVAIAAPPPAQQPCEARIAFTSTRGEERGIFVMSADGGDAARLTTHRLDGLPAWSPDARRIAFLSARGNDEAELDRFSLAMHRMLYLMQADGSGIRRVSEAPVAGMRWSPDGLWLLFQSSYEDENNYHVEDWVSSAIYLIAGTGGRHKRLTDTRYRNAFPSWSPDGERIAFSSDRDGDWELYVMHRDGSRQRRLTNSPAAERYPLWSPDGRKLAFSARDTSVEQRGPSGHSNIHTLDLETREVRHLSAAPAAETPRAWSPDGAWILFATQEDLFLVHHTRPPDWFASRKRPPANSGRRSTPQGTGSCFARIPTGTGRSMWCGRTGPGSPISPTIRPTSSRSPLRPA